MFNLVSINKIQRSRLTFQPRLLILESHQHIKTLFSEKPLGQLKPNFITPYDWLAKTYTNSYGHMTNMATMPIYGQNFLYLFSLKPKGLWLWDLVCIIGDVGPTKFTQMMNLG